MKVLKIISAICLFAVLSACASGDISTRRTEAYSIAYKAGFSPFKLRSQLFGFNGFYKQGKESRYPVVYIEGDGFAWIDRYTISPNPTPRNPLALKLAVQDSGTTIFYLARPCQYVDLKKEPYCKNAYWTNARFAAEVIDSFDQAFTLIKKKTKNEGFHLVGFSGGGAIATLLAAKRTDIKSIRTIAGNLDHVSLNAYRKVSALNGSLNPMNIVGDIQAIPQIHYSGSEDKVVPQWIATNFLRKANNANCMSTHLVSGAAHMQGWEEAWSLLHRQYPEC
ncbi:alpha/beta hydrolase [Terasakiella sp. SH-1]|uniref:alpha/beta fold hydrolase n=1 Tax=Terasakiella sp. SH-1 TaxID=2560057 RepID=UPI001430691E|nr:alpha/beta hydrolase [Terasakiella sp. SH-1]